MILLKSLRRCDANLNLLQDVIRGSLSGLLILTSGFGEVVATGKALDLRNKPGTWRQEGAEMKCREGIPMICINLQRFVDLSESLTGFLIPKHYVYTSLCIRELVPSKSTR